MPLEARALPSTLTVTTDVDGGDGSLRALLADASDGDTIDFAPAAYGTIDLTGGPLRLATDVDICGPGAGSVTVSGGGQSTVFEVTGGVTATITGLTITDGLADPSNGPGGGGILNDGDLTLRGDVIAGNSAPTGVGGGVLTEGPLTVIGSTIAGNSASSGGGLASLGAPVTIVGSTIAANLASNGAGIATTTGSLTVTNSTIAGNSAAGGGGGIWAGSPLQAAGAGPVMIAGSTIAGNSAASGGGLQDFGGPTTIAGSRLSTNAAEIGGGIDSHGGPLTVVSSILWRNSATSRGGIASTGSMSLTACTVTGNLGGGIGIDGSAYGFGPIPTLTVTGSVISGNSGASEGGGILCIAGDVIVSNSTVAGNTAAADDPGGESDGGGIDMEDSLSAPRPGADSLTITGTTFNGNRAVDGGAIHTGAADAVVSVVSSSFFNNTASGEGPADGGAMDLDGLSRGTIAGCQFTGNRAIGGPSGGVASGGAIVLDGRTGGGPSAPGIVTIQGSTFTNNAAQGGLGGDALGGAIDCETEVLTIVGSTIAGNTAAGGAQAGDASGGGLRSTGSILTLIGTMVAGNRAIGGAGGTAQGGGVAVSGGSATFSGDQISLNAAIGGSGQGGGLYIAAGALTTLRGTPVAGNTASTAGNDIDRPYTVD